MASKSVGGVIKAVASKVKMAVQKSAPPKDSEAPEKEAPETPDAPLPLLDLSDAAVKKMIKQAKKRGYVTYEQLNAVMPSEEVTSEKIEDVLAMMSEMGINVVETEEAEADEAEEEAREEPEEEESEGGELVETTAKAPAKSEAKEPAERTDDPVRMYLREMGSVELLSREGEIAIAKRIEAGREAMIAGLCESPLTFQAVIIWRDELNEGKVFLRDIIDLEATYAGPDAKTMPAAAPADPAAAAAAGAMGAAHQAAPPGTIPFAQPPQTVAPPSAPPGATPFKPAAVNGAGAVVKTAARKPRSPTPTSTRTIWKTRCRSPPSKPSSSPKCWRPSTLSRMRSSACAGCRNSTFPTSSRTNRSRPRRSASRRS
jgi:RNA polymerase primary sigma factor